MRIKTKHHLFLSVFLCTALVFSIVPVSAMAASEPPVVTAIVQFENLKVEAYSRQIKLKWNEISGVNGYELYCANSNDNQPVLLADLSLSSSTSFNYRYDDPTLQYAFTLKSYIILNGDKYYSDSANCEVTPYMLAETKFLGAYKVKSADPMTGAATDYIDYIFWDFLPKVSGYEVYCEARNTEWLETTIEPPRVGFFSKPGGLLASMYRVRPYYMINGNIKYGPSTEQYLVHMME